ncbi:MAG: hypothetical protein H6729_11570 [Deltaproteobacteria bacterium]|nr:hypothetical protein [Deltaproteobacteria bacterium]
MEVCPICNEPTFSEGRCGTCGFSYLRGTPAPRSATTPSASTPPIRRGTTVPSAIPYPPAVLGAPAYADAEATLEEDVVERSSSSVDRHADAEADRRRARSRARSARAASGPATGAQPEGTEFNYQACPRCGAPRSGEATVLCEKCGFRLRVRRASTLAAEDSRRCRQCGVANQQTAERCVNCGCKL